MDFGWVKSIFIFIFLSKFVTKAVKEWITNLEENRKNTHSLNRKLKRNKKNTHPVSQSTENYLKIYHIFMNVICYICLENCKNCMNIYRVIFFLIKKMPVF